MSGQPTRLDWGGVAAYTAIGVLAALLEVFLLPLYVGSVIVPLSIVLAVVGNVAGPWLSRSLVGSTTGAVLPFLAWVLVVLVLAMLPRPEGDVIVPGAGSVELVFWGTLIGGTVAGLITIVVTTPTPPAPAVDGPTATRGRPISR
jgi:hypothetical protein